jgi:hypothetical protein
MPRLRVRPSLETCLLFFHAKQWKLHHFFSAPSGHATKRAGYQQGMLNTRYNAAALLFQLQNLVMHPFAQLAC